VVNVGDDLIARAKRRAETPPTPEERGFRLVLAEGDGWVGRWRGETTDEDNGRRVYLLLTSSNEPCFSRDYTALGREVDRAKPQVGELVAIFRGADYVGQGGNPGFSFGLETEPCDEPLPGGEATPADIPF
jgi:hypothetical protein